MDASKSLILMDGTTGMPLVRIDLPSYVRPRAVTGRGVLWFTCGRGAVCAVSIDAPTTVIGGERDPAITVVAL